MSSALRQHFEKITPLTDDEFSYVMTHFSTKKLKKHQYLLQAGDTVQYDYFVVAGLVKAYFANPDDGKEHIMQFAMEDWWVTDYQAYFNQTPSMLYIDCIEEGAFQKTAGFVILANVLYSPSYQILC